MANGQMLALVLGVVLGTADFPEVGVHGCFASRCVLLRLEVNLVLRDFGEVLFARRDHGLYGGESFACREFRHRRLCSASVGIRFSDVESRAIGVLCRSDAVCSDEVVAMFVTVNFFGFCQCTLYELDTRGVGNFSHSNAGYA